MADALAHLAFGIVCYDTWALHRRILLLRAKPPITTAFERALTKQGAWTAAGVWYKSRKEHWLGWLSEYNGPGFIGRKTESGRSAEFVYRHVVCPPMLIWLAESAGVKRSIVLAAQRAALSARPSLPSKSATIRKIVPWQLIVDRLG